MFFLLVLVAFVIVIAARLTASARKQFDRIRAKGRPALGIVLAIDAIGTTLQGSATRFSGQTANGSSTYLRNSVHRKNARIDVEIPGQPPYQVTTSVLMPLNMAGDVLPGSTVELRVDPARPKLIVIVGPGAGFTDLARTPTVFRQDMPA